MLMIKLIMLRDSTSMSKVVRGTGLLFLMCSRAQVQCQVAARKGLHRITVAHSKIKFVYSSLRAIRTTPTILIRRPMSVWNRIGQIGLL